MSSPPGRFALLSLLACSACGDDGNTVADAAIDALPDPCAPEMTFTGEYVDWDSTASSFMGIFGATFSVGTKTASTAPNGRFSLCVPASDAVAEITSMTGSNYVAGSVVVNRAVIERGAMLSYRSFTTTRAAAYGFSATQAHVFVHIHGAARTVATAANASIMKTFNGSSWVDGNSGTDVYLGNVDPQGTTMLTVTGGNALGAGTIPLAEGKFTYVTVVAN